MNQAAGNHRGAGPAKALATGLRIVTFAGADATSFLDAQSMTALSALPAETVRLSAFADARGRVLAVAPAWRTADVWRLALPADEADRFAEHLARYRLRSRVEITVHRDTPVAGFAGPVPDGVPAPAPGTAAMRDGLETAALDSRRNLVAAWAGAARPPFDVPAPGDGESPRWKQARLLAGEPRIESQARAAYLPQMLALDDLGAVSFAKGCYPGQEVIARTRNFGRVKRRTVLLHGREAVASGPVEIDGVKVDVLDCAQAPGGGFLVQAVAPDPLPAELSARRRAAQAESNKAS